MDLRALRELQSIDTRIDQENAAAARLAERTEHANAVADLARVRSRRDDLRRSQAAMESELATIEASSSDIDAQRTRLEKQLKTVIAPREAEALQHELANLAARRNELDDRGLVLLESSAEADELLAELETVEARSIAVEADRARALADAESIVAARLAELSAERDRITSAVGQSELAEYERRRKAQSGVAVTEVQNGRCNGCHMDISVSELEAIKRLPVEVDAECPNCSRLLVR